MSVWREGDHPRGDDGRFIEKISAYIRSGKSLPLMSNGTFNVVKFEREYEKLCSSTHLDAPNAGEKAIPYSERGIEIDIRLRGYLEELKNDGDYIVGRKGSFSPEDLSILSTEEGVEFATLTIGAKTYLLRGGERSTTIPDDIFVRLIEEHGTLDCHSHPYIMDLMPSKEDADFIRKLEWQEKSMIVDPNGRMTFFNKEGLIIGR
jgi:hypothetical protein